MFQDSCVIISTMDVCICDDNSAERNVLRGFLELYASEKALRFNITEYEDSALLLDSLLENGILKKGSCPSILFMDIFMDNSNGMEDTKKLFKAGFSSSIVFCTTSKDYALDSYSVNAEGYLLKPYTWEQFTQVMERINNKWSKSTKVISFTSNRVETIVSLEDVQYIETKNKGCLVHVSNEAIDTSKIISSFEEELKEYDFFCKMGKSFLINLNKVKSFDDNNIYMINGDNIVLPVRSKQEIKRVINNWRWQKMRES
ncbi:MAG: response regulator transcription factor [Sphaerochaetaceae bacterium]|nr:response regulator transcription factor [Sphaerochaetaceae bacterium]